MRNLIIIDKNIFLENTLISVETLLTLQTEEFKVFIYPNQLSEAMGKILIKKCNVIGIYNLADTLINKKNILCKIGSYTIFYDGQIHMLPPANNAESLLEIWDTKHLKSRFHWKIYTYLLYKYIPYICVIVLVLDCYLIYKYWLYGVDTVKKTFWLDKFNRGKL